MWKKKISSGFRGKYNGCCHVMANANMGSGAGELQI